MPTLLLSPTEAPRAWPVPGDVPAHVDGSWRDRVGALPSGDVLVTGGEPLRLSDLQELLAGLGAEGRRTTLHTDLPGLDDDLQVRPFSAWDVRFRVRLPDGDPTRFAACTGADLEPVRAGLRNLQAFGFPFEVEVPLAPATLPHLADTVALALGELGVRSVRLRAEPGVAPTVAAGVGEALLDLDARALRPHARLVLDGLPALALPVDRLVDVDVRTDDPPDAPWPPGLDDVDVRARRRMWLVTRPQDRATWRGHPLDRLGEPTSLVLLREGHEVYAVVDRVRDDRRLLARAGGHGLSIAGRFADPVLAARFGVLARALWTRVQEAPPADLAALRVLAHVLRRSLKPRHDGAPAMLREEGSA